MKFLPIHYVFFIMIFIFCGKLAIYSEDSHFFDKPMTDKQAISYFKKHYKINQNIEGWDTELTTLMSKKIIDRMILSQFIFSITPTMLIEFQKDTPEMLLYLLQRTKFNLNQNTYLSTTYADVIIKLSKLIPENKRDLFFYLALEKNIRMSNNAQDKKFDLDCFNKIYEDWGHTHNVDKRLLPDAQINEILNLLKKKYSKISLNYVAVVIKLSQLLPQKDRSKYFYNAVYQNIISKKLSYKNIYQVNNYFALNDFLDKMNYKTSPKFKDLLLLVKSQETALERIHQVLSNTDFSNWNVSLSNMAKSQQFFFQEKFKFYLNQLNENFEKENKRKPTNDDDLWSKAEKMSRKWLYTDKNSPLYIQGPNPFINDLLDESIEHKYWLNFFLIKFIFLSNMNEIKIDFDIKRFFTLQQKTGINFTPNEQNWEDLRSNLFFREMDGDWPHEVLFRDKANKLRYVQFFWERSEMNGPANDIFVELLYRQNESEPYDCIVLQTPTEIGQELLVPLLNK